MAKAVITWDMEESFVDYLSTKLSEYGIDVIQTGKERDTIYRELGDADVIFAGLADRDIIERAPRLKFIQALTSSVGRIDLSYAASRGIPVSSAKGHNANAIAEHIIMLMLMLTRKAGTREHIDSYEIEELSGKTLCELGVGCIGTALGKKCHALGMRILGVDLYPRDFDFLDQSGTPDKLPYFLPEADFFTVHVPRTPQTHNMVNGDVLKHAPDSLYFVDVSRGGITNDDDLYTAIAERRLRGAAMDVFPGVFYADDRPAHHPLFDLPNFIYTPHTAGKSAESRKRLADFSVYNVKRYFNGEMPLNVVDPNVGF